MSDTATLLAFLILCWISFYIVRHFVSSPDKNYPPMVRMAFPIVGHLPLFGSNPPTTFKKWQRQYGDIYSIRLGGLKTVVLNGHRLIKEAMNRKGDVFSDRLRSFTKETIKKVYDGHESFTLHPFNQSYLQIHKTAATVLHKVTHINLMQTQELILDETSLLIQELLCLKGEPDCINQAIQITINKIIYQLLYGRGKSIRDDERFQSIIVSCNEIVELNGGGNPFDVMPWLQYIMPWKARRFLRTIGKAVAVIPLEVEEHLNNFDKHHLKDVTDMLLATDLPEETKDETRTLTKSGLLLPVLNELMQGGQETTSTTLVWLILYMTAFPDVQELIHKEIDEIVGTGRSINIRDKPQLCYTVATIYETMRITSISPFAIPHCAMNNAKLDGFDIEKGSVIIVNQHSANMDESVWKDPETFRPERLLNNKHELDNDICNHILPFGLGRRKCSGEHLAKLNLFLIFSNLMQRFTFKKAGSGAVDLTAVPGLVYKPQPTEIVITER